MWHALLNINGKLTWWPVSATDAAAYAFFQTFPVRLL